MKSPFVYIATFLVILLTSCSSTKTSVETIKEVTQKVKSKNFTVLVNSANPMRMNLIYLTSEFDLRIKNDSAFAYLPYYGVVHTAPIDASEGGIKFAAPTTSYKISPNKKSTGWDIEFRVKSKTIVYDIYMNVFNNGSSMVSVRSSDRDGITFNGVLKLNQKK